MPRLGDMKTKEVIELAYKSKWVYGNTNHIDTLRNFATSYVDDFVHSKTLDSKKTLQDLHPNHYIQEIMQFFDNEKEAKQVIYKDVIDLAMQLQEKYEDLLTKEGASDE